MATVVAQYDVALEKFKLKIFYYASRDDILAGFRKVCPNIIIDSYTGTQLYFGTLAGLKNQLVEYNDACHDPVKRINGVFIVHDEQVWWVPNLRTSKFKLIEEYRGKVFPWRKK